MNSILAAALGGAVGGALGSLLGNLVGRAFPEKWRKTIQTAFTVALVIAGWRVAVAVLAPPTLQAATAPAIERQLLESSDVGPMARAWRAADPESFRRFVEGMRASARSGASEEQIVNQSRAALQAEAIPRLLRLSDEQVLQIAEISRDQFRELRQSRPSVCKPFFMGEPFGDITPYVSADSVQRERDLLVASFSADLSAERQIASGDAFAVTLDKVLSATRARVGDNILMLMGQAEIAGRDAEYCEAAAVFFEEVLSLPQAESAALMRALRAPA